MSEKRICRRSFWGMVTGAVAALLGLPRIAHGAGFGPRRGHNCPVCGTLVLNVYRMNYPYQGVHTHRHGDNFWYHPTTH